jgi:hypothetical protein
MQRFPDTWKKKKLKSCSISEKRLETITNSKKDLKQLLIITFLISFSLVSISQKLAGVWKGTFETFNPGQKGTSQITLKFIPGKKSFEVLSYSTSYDSLEKKNIIFVCKLKYQMIGADSINLEEKKLISPAHYIGACLQKMFLKIKKVKGDYIMEGIWRSEETGCHLLGTMKLIKQKEE